MKVARSKSDDSGPMISVKRSTALMFQPLAASPRRRCRRECRSRRSRREIVEQDLQRRERQERQHQRGHRHREHVAEIRARAHADIFHDVRIGAPALHHAVGEYGEIVVEQDDVRRSRATRVRPRPTGRHRRREWRARH